MTAVAEFVPGFQRPKDRLWWLAPKTDGTYGLDIGAHRHQQRVLDATARFICMLAGSQGGKTALGPIWLEREIAWRGEGDYLAVTSNFPLLKKKMLPEFLRLFRDTLDLGTWSPGDKVFTYHDGKTRILFGSATSPESLESATAKAAWLDEAGQVGFRLESWEAIQRRVALYRGRVLLTTTPYAPNWLKVEVYERWKAGDPDYAVIQFASIENPAFPPEEFERLQRGLPGWKFRMFYQGLFDTPPGLIYAAYRDEPRPQGHLVKPFPIAEYWPRFIGLDFGGSNTAKLYIAQDPMSGLYYVYDTQLDGGKTAAQHTADVRAALGGAPLAGCWGGAPGEEAMRLEFSAAGLVVDRPPVADVEVGIDRVVGLFQDQRLYVFDTCRGLRDELGSYSREVDPAGTILPSIREKRKFHRLDALRYVALGIGGEAMGAMPVLVVGGARGWQPRGL